MKPKPQTHHEAIAEFKSKAPAGESILTLGGTGPNGSTQVLPLYYLGQNYLSQLAAINILSASSFAYFIFLAFEQNQLKRQNYLNYDTRMRRMHRASFFRAAKHFARWRLPSKPLYDNALVKSTVELLFEEGFAHKPLSDFDANLTFWAFCSASDKNVAITAKTFPDMKVWEVISACLSIQFIHGEFIYREHRFSDPIFSSSFSGLRRKILRSKCNHLYLNFKKTHQSNNVHFLKNSSSRAPMVELFIDFLLMVSNIPNARINRLHAYTTNVILDDSRHLKALNEA